MIIRKEGITVRVNYEKQSLTPEEARILQDIFTLLREDPGSDLCFTNLEEMQEYLDQQSNLRK